MGTTDINIHDPANSGVSIIKIWNPFEISESELYRTSSNVTIQSICDTEEEFFQFPSVCFLNGDPILRCRWENISLKDGDILILQRVFKATAGFFFAAFVLYLSLNLFVDFGLIPQNPFLPGLRGLIERRSTKRRNDARASPTYNISQQGNTIRYGEAVPVLYGKLRIYPDFIHEPVSVYTRNIQSIRSNLVLTQGLCEISDVRLGNTFANSLEGVVSRKLDPGVRLGTGGFSNGEEIVSEEVNSVQVDAGRSKGKYFLPVTRNTEDLGRLTHIQMNFIFPNGLLRLSSSSGALNTMVTITAYAQQVDVHGNNIGSEIQLHISGASLGGTPTSSNVVEYTARSRTRILNTVYYHARVAGFYDLNSGDYYTIQVRKSEQHDGNDISVTNNLVWQDLISIYLFALRYDFISVLQVGMTVTDQINQVTSRKINCVASRLIRTWHPDTLWSEPMESSSIPWIIADMLKADYGGRLTDTHIDLRGFYELHLILTARGDFFNGIFDRRQNLLESVREVARVARCSVIIEGGLFKIIRDKPQQIPVMMFTPRNIIHDSFSIQYNTAPEDENDGVTVRYIDPVNWKEDEISVDMNNEIPDNPAEIELFGCTNRNQAIREGIYHARLQRYRRELIKFDTDLSGLIVKYGDLVVVSHDLPIWSQSGDIIEFDEDNITQEHIVSHSGLRLRLSEHLDFGTGQNYLLISDLTGGLFGPFLCTMSETPFEVLLRHTSAYRFHLVNTGNNMSLVASSDGTDASLDTPTLFPYWKQTGAINSTSTMLKYPDDAAERRKYLFSSITSQNNLNKLCLVRSIKPRGEHRVQIDLVSEDIAVHQVPTGVM